MRMVRRWLAVAVVAWGLAGTATLAATIRGKVTAEDGTPAVGVHVWAARFGDYELDRRDTTTDAAGQFAIPVVPGNWTIAATLGAQGATNEHLVQVMSATFDPDPVAIRLAPRSRLRGRLIEAETGQPIAGGRFVLDNGEVPVSDHDGRFEVAGLHRATHHAASVVAPGREHKLVLFDLSERPTTDLEVAVPRGAKAVGLVLDPDGRPIPRAAVGRSRGGKPLTLTHLWTRTDAKGRFEYDGLVPGQIAWLYTQAEGFDGSQRRVQPGPRGGPVALLIRLDRIERNEAIGSQAVPIPQNLRNVTGVVTDPAGQPVAGVLVRYGLQRAPNVDETRTDAAGKFQFPDRHSQPWLISLWPEGADLSPAVTLIPANENQDIAVRLSRSRTITGVVRDDAGTPLRHVRVTPVLAKANEWALPLADRGTATDAQGRFVLARVPDGTPQANFETNDDAWDEYNHPLIFDQENVVTLQASGVIRGRVVDPAGRPVRNFRVLVSHPRDQKPDEKMSNLDNWVRSTGVSFTTDDGSFLIRNLTAGSFQRVTVLAAGFGAAVAERMLVEPRYRPARDPLPTFRLGPPHALTVHVVDEQAQRPLQGARVALIGDGPEVDQFPDRAYNDFAQLDSAYAVTDEAGTAAFSALSIAEGTVLVQLPGYPQRHVGWRDGARDLHISLQPEAVVVGELVDQVSGQPLTDVFVRLVSPINGQFGKALTATDAGRFRFGDLREGNFTLTVVTTDNKPLHEETIVVKPGEQIRLRLRLDPSKAPDDADFVPPR